MDTLEFLGGKYQGGEQILPGVIQTYRAMESSTGRSVFVHRVASSDDPHEQMVLFRLLSAALVRSPAVRSMVLDVREDTRDWYVVTETDPRCLLLREWLQFELDGSGKAPEEEKKASVADLSDPVLAGSIMPPPQLPNSSSATAKAFNEPGEFTRFFQSGPSAVLPPKFSALERTTRTGIVQRPSTPMPVVPPAPPFVNNEEGEFTKMFNRSQAQDAPPQLTPPGTRQSSADFDNLFAPTPEFAMPAPSAGPQAGEFTRMFGDSKASPVHRPSALGERARTDFDDPLAIPGAPGRTGALHASEPASISSAAGSAGPSEYTRIIGGNRPLAGGEATPAPGGPSNSAIALPSTAILPMPPQAPAPVVPPLPAATVPPVPALSPQPPVPATPTQAGSPANRKLIIFLSALGALALILILLVFFALKK